MHPVFYFIFGIAVLGLFFWYFGVDEIKAKRRVGTILSLLVTLFCLYIFVAPRDGRLIETLTQGNKRGDDGRLFGNIPLGIDLRGGNSFTVRIDPAGPDRPVTPDVQEQARAILEKRLNAFGTVDMAIIPQGADRLEIQMPGVKKEDFDAVRQVIQRVAKLEFRLVHQRSSELLAQKKPGEPLIEPGYAELPLLRERAGPDEDAQDKAKGFTALRGPIKEITSKNEFKISGKTVVTDETTQFSGGAAGDIIGDRYVEAIGRFKDEKFRAAKLHFLPSIVVKVRNPKTDVSGQDVTLAIPRLEAGGWMVTLGLSSEGAEKMEQATRENVGRQLAIILDGEVLSAPAIRDVLRDNIQISGSFTETQVRDLASALNNPLENPLVIINENAISAAYGGNTIKQGVYAGLAGMASILVFMLLYYRTAGFVAIIGVVVNTIILFGFMAISHSTLTMLGIAGILLTLGMGVDANVLIYERLREELKSGKSLWAAIHAGYDRAFSAIFDGHMTSLLTAVILFWLAGGTIRGFAVSLTIGVLASLFGSLLVTRTLFNYFPQIKKLTFLDLIKGMRFDFMGRAKYWIGFSVVATLVAIAALATKRENALGPDLRGGDKITISSTTAVSADVAGEAARSVDKSAVAQVKNTLQGDSFLEVRTSPEKGQDVLQAISAKVGTDLSKSTEGIQIEKIGAQVGTEMLRTSAWALLAGVVGILIYLTFRFEFSFSLGALAALVHDVMFCIGAIVLTGRDLNLLQVGALLTVAGYSVTDTVVIFDRIREYFHTHKGSLKEIMNDAISSTLSRTLLTSICTLITVIFLYFFGGPQLSDFAFTIIVGILIGTYSSIFVASPIVLWWARKRQIDLRKDVLDAAAARALSQSGVEREVAPRKL
ncbi:MAG: protein translocase subunit SecD [Verrucomicrobiales bacterium]